MYEYPSFLEYTALIHHSLNWKSKNSRCLAIINGHLIYVTSRAKALAELLGKCCSLPARESTTRWQSTFWNVVCVCVCVCGCVCVCA